MRAERERGSQPEINHPFFRHYYASRVALSLVRRRFQCARYFIEVKRMMVFTPPKAAIHQTAERCHARYITHPLRPASIFFTAHSKLKKRSVVADDIQYAIQLAPTLDVALSHSFKNKIVFLLALPILLQSLPQWRILGLEGPGKHL
jgi:hypothetical protein